jgi:dipeptide/tripeptide permease
MYLVYSPLVSVIAYFTNLIGGWYADTKAGRYWTIFFANLINLLGQYEYIHWWENPLRIITDKCVSS